MKKVLFLGLMTLVSGGQVSAAVSEAVVADLESCLVKCGQQNASYAKSGMDLQVNCSFKCRPPQSNSISGQPAPVSGKLARFKPVVAQDPYSIQPGIVITK